MITASRYHEIHCGHRVVGQGGKCENLHGHGYVIHFNCIGLTGCEIDTVGRVIDFSEIKSRLCQWLEDNWDHKTLIWDKDTMIKGIYELIPGKLEFQDSFDFQSSIVFIPFNPTAENIAEYLVNVIGPQQLVGTGIELRSVIVEETRKCSASYSKD